MPQTPFTTFNFRVLVTLDSGSGPLCDAGFSECAGLEQSVEVKTLRQGGDNARQIHLSGPVGYGTLTLKRGMTSSFDLWDWFERVNTDGERHLRAETEVLMLHSDRTVEQAAFVLGGCLPSKLSAPALTAADGQVAIEELQVVYETLRLRRPEVSS